MDARNRPMYNLNPVLHIILPATVARSMIPPLRCLILSTAILVAAGARATCGTEEIDFNRDIRPLLSENCYACHGPDDAERQAGLRLDTRDGQLAQLESGERAVVSGDVEQSELLRRVSSDESGYRMPPVDFGKELDSDDVELIRRWIAGGAEYSQHWSYVKPARPEVPQMDGSDWPRNEIDCFLLARLDREGLAPSAEAERYALIRRLSLDLTGLPPTLDEVHAFVDDTSADAYDRLVDRLLAQPTYGEHWARMWLDLARYADSAGYADDPPRTIWGYRDWVIRALNDNLPFDQFTIEQLAGDLLPDPTIDQLIATAFHRNTQTNNEGGTDDEEYRNVAIVDRVNTTMAVWMGTTMACAQCHNHKYDPISQEEYFQLYAILNNTQDADQRDESPVIELWADEKKQRKQELQQLIADLEQQLNARPPELLAAQTEWERQMPAWTTAHPANIQTRSGQTAEIGDDGIIFIAAAGDETDVYDIEIPVAENGSLAALRIETIPHASLPNLGAGHGRGDFVVTRVLAAIKPADASPAGDATPAENEAQGARVAQQIEFTGAYADFSQERYDAKNVLEVEEPNKRGWAVNAQITLPHALTLVTDTPVELPAGGTLTVTIEHLSAVPRHTLGNFRVALTDDTSARQYAALESDIVAILRLPPESRSEDQQSDLTAAYVTVAPLTEDVRQRVAAMRKELDEAKPYTTVPILREISSDDRRATKIQRRGNFLDTGAEVSQGLPGVFHRHPDEAAINRLTLASWLVDEDNPLTARVIANRYWEAIFGHGIVTTSEEFGSQGELPTHPELLDWLATELVRIDWDRKAFLRLLVTSAAYRQSSRLTDDMYQRDPDNLLLARGPRFRLSAEMIRDQSLFVSGLLSAKMYGPPARPLQPKLGNTAAFGPAIDWETSDGEDRYRRGLYTMWRRSSPYPSMATFDAPNREVCTVRRDRTNTPLQALVTLNDPVYVEAAQALARRMVENGQTTADKARFGFRLCLARPPNDAELNMLTTLYDQSLFELAGNVEQATSLATEPLGAAPAGVDVIELAAWTVVANVLLNLDEMFLKR